MLTGKAKEDFEKWLKKQSFVNFNKYTKKIIIDNKIYSELNERFVSTLIIEWFDSAGIYITTEIMAKNIFSFRIDYDNIFDCEECFKTRQEAQVKAIEKANEIYNKLNQ